MFVKRRLTALVIGTVCALLIAPMRLLAAPPAQDPVPMRYGDTQPGTITESVPCQYFAFEGAAGDPVTIDMTRTGGDLDGVLALYQGAGTESAPVAENDDRPGGGLDPLIDTRLPANGRYTIAACRLQTEGMRITTGTFTLALTGPQTPTGPTPTPAGALSDSTFGSLGGESAPTATPAPTAAGDGPLTGLFGGPGVPTLADGSTVSGELAASDDAVRFNLPLAAGDVVTLVWTRTGGDLAPRLAITGADGAALAEATTPDPVGELTLQFSAPRSETAALAVTRYAAEDGTAPSGTSGSFTLAVSIMPAASNDVAPEATSEATPSAGSPAQPATTPDTTPDTSAYLANPCQSGEAAITGLGSTDILIDVYTASGDSFYPDELARTEVFRTDDDLNVVFQVQNISEPVHLGGVFCAPDGSIFDAGEGFAETGIQLLGLDWEFHGEPWPTGRWFVEIYAQGELALSIAFEVQ